MFMIEKSLIIIIFVYCTSFTLLGAQYIWGDVFHVTMTNFQGVPLKDNLLNDVNQNTINSVSNDITKIRNDPTTLFTNSLQIVWDAILLISGLYIFDILTQLGIPIVFTAGFASLYIFFLLRTIGGWVRGI